MKPLKYFLYCRRSQDREDDQVLSIESQKRELMAYAEKHALNVVEVICEDASAYKRGRPKFKWMMDEIEKGKANAVLTWHLTRLARNGADGGLIITFMDEARIVELRTTEKVYTNTGDDKFMMTIHFAMAKKSSDDTSAFVKNNLKTKIANKEYPGQVRYGYLNVGTNGVIAGKRYDPQKQAMLEQLGRPLLRVEQDPIVAPLIRKLIDLALLGTFSITTLSEKAEELGIIGKLSRKGLSKQGLFDLLGDIFYTGKFKYQGEIHEGAHEPLMTEEEYMRIQDFLRRRSHPQRARHDYTFATIVICPECNGAMSGEFQKNIHYYRCGRAKGKNPACANKKHLRQDQLEIEIEETLQALTLPGQIIDWALKTLQTSFLQENKVLTGKRTLLQMNINEERQKLERLTAKWLSAGNVNGFMISDEEYVEQKKVIVSSISKTEELLSSNNNEEDTWLSKCEAFFEKIRNIDHQYKYSDPYGKRIILQSIGAKFIRKGDKMAVQVEKPYAFVIERDLLSKVSSEREYAFTVDQKGSFDEKKNDWLGRLESNQQPCR